jgi:hypothetical protein
MGIRDVRDGLATSLGAAYQLDRELGAGGTVKAVASSSRTRPSSDVMWS